MLGFIGNQMKGDLQMTKQQTNRMSIEECHAWLEEDSLRREAFMVGKERLAKRKAEQEVKYARLMEWLAACPDATFTEITKTEEWGNGFIVSVDCVITKPHNWEMS